MFMNMKRIVLIIAAVMMISSCACRNESQQASDTQTEMENTIISEPEFEMVTSHGTMKIKLYGKTPKHRDNFKKLVAEKYYDDIRKDWTAEAGKFKAYIGASSVDIRTVVPFVLE